MTTMKTYFLILNMVVAVLAFSWMVSGDDIGEDTTNQVDSAVNTEGSSPPSVAPQTSKVIPPVKTSGVVDFSKLKPGDKLLLPDGRKVTYSEALDGGKIFKDWKGESIPLDANDQAKATLIKPCTDGPLCSWNIDDKLKLTEIDLVKDLGSAAIAFGVGYGIGGALIGDNGDVALGSAFATATLLSKLGAGTATSLIIGAAVFIAIYKKKDIIKVEFACLPWEAPTGGADCQKCNEYEECSEYRCKSLGQACQLQDEAGEKLCAWVNEGDVNSPLIEMIEVNKGHDFVPDTSVRPPAVGVEVRKVEEGPCIEAFTPLEFTIRANEPAQCKVDYDLTNDFEEMSYYVGGTNAFSYNHTETMALPGPANIEAIAPELENDGTYTLYVRCQDANGNFNQDPYSVRFCVKPGPDTTPPRIDDTNVPSDSGVRFNQSTLDLDVYVNEPSECKWSREDKDYTLMENEMVCENNLWDMKKINNNWIYICRTTLTSVVNRQDNKYYFRCKDNPGAAEGDRFENKQSYLYNIIGTQPLTLLELKPNEGEVVRGSTATVPVMLEVKTDNGYNNGEAVCSYTESDTTPGYDDYIEFSETGGSVHSQSQHLLTGTYNYHIRCVDLSGNAIFENVNFEVESDNNPPLVVRAYKQAGQLRIVTSEDTECAYSNKDCNFEIAEGIQMSSINDRAHAVDWLTDKNYYIRCKDDFQNQPGLSEGAEGCSIVIRPYELVVKENVIEL